MRAILSSADKPLKVPHVSPAHISCTLPSSCSTFLRSLSTSPTCRLEFLVLPETWIDRCFEASARFGPLAHGSHLTGGVCWLLLSSCEYSSRLIHERSQTYASTSLILTASGLSKLGPGNFQRIRGNRSWNMFIFHVSRSVSLATGTSLLRAQPPQPWRG
jgi:hypothetical protein